MSLADDEQILLSLCIVRHGLREDFIDESWKAAHPLSFNDPPLADLGLQQALETGEFLQKTYSADTRWSKECRVLVSPFLRTKQTGTNIARALGVSQLGVEYGLSEWFTDKNRVNGSFEPLSLFTARPLEQVELEHRSQLLPDDADYKTFVPLEESVPPESVEQLHERCLHLITSLTTNVQHPPAHQGYPLLVLVTHASTLVSLIMGAFQSESITSSISACVCSVVRIDIVSNGSGTPRLQLVWTGRTDHLSTGGIHPWDFSKV